MVACVISEKVWVTTAVSSCISLVTDRTVRAYSTSLRLPSLSVSMQMVSERAIAPK